MIDPSMPLWIINCSRSLEAARRETTPHSVESYCQNSEKITSFLENMAIDDTNFIMWELERCFISSLEVMSFALYLLYTYGHMAVYILIAFAVLYTMYKAYFSPVLIIKDMTDVGFDHITGPGREARISRARQSRRLGANLPPPYPNGWFALLESQDLAAGGVKAVNALGENLCVYRTEDGVARCVDAYCPHLGANLAVGGVVVDGCIECPFHKWRFSGVNGECVAVPGLDTPPRTVSTRAWETCEAAGAVWVWYESAATSPAWRLPTLPPPAGWGYRGRSQHVVSCHVQEIPENGADVAHLNAVHASSLLTNLGEKYPLLLNLLGRHVWSAEWSRSMTEQHIAHVELNHVYRIGKIGFGRISIDTTQIGPGAVCLRVRTAAGPLLISQSVTPLSPSEQLVVHRFFSPWWNAPVAALFVYGEAAMFERDLAIWNSKQYFARPGYVRSDKSIRSFRAWFSQFYSEGSLSFREATRRPADLFDW